MDSDYLGETRLKRCLDIKQANYSYTYFSGFQCRHLGFMDRRWPHSTGSGTAILRRDAGHVDSICAPARSRVMFSESPQPGRSAEKHEAPEAWRPNPNKLLMVDPLCALCTSGEA